MQHSVSSASDRERRSKHAGPWPRASGLVAAAMMLGGASIASAQDTGQLVVVTTPPGLTVLVDGVPAGTSPATATGLLPGAHVVVVRSVDGRSATQVVETEAGRSAVVQIELGAAEPRPDPEVQAPVPEPSIVPPPTEPGRVGELLTQQQAATAIVEPPGNPPDPHPVVPAPMYETRILADPVRLSPAERFSIGLGAGIAPGYELLFGDLFLGARIHSRANALGMLRLSRFRLDIETSSAAISLGLRAVYADFDGPEGPTMAGPGFSLDFRIPAIYAGNLVIRIMLPINFDVGFSVEGVREFFGSGSRATVLFSVGFQPGFRLLYPFGDSGAIYVGAGAQVGFAAVASFIDPSLLLAGSVCFGAEFRP